jgi:hypothetical protein
MTLAPLLAGVLYTQSPVVVYPVSLGLVGVALLLSIAFTPRQIVDEPAAANQSLEL